MAANTGSLLRCWFCLAKRHKLASDILNAQRKNFSLCPQVAAGGAFRRERGKAEDSLAYGPLTDTPDWTYLDGSLPPLSKGQIKRQKKRIETSNRIVTLLKEINEAKAKAQNKENCGKL